MAAQAAGCFDLDVQQRIQFVAALLWIWRDAVRWSGWRRPKQRAGAVSRGGECYFELPGARVVVARRLGGRPLFTGLRPLAALARGGGEWLRDVPGVAGGLSSSERKGYRLWGRSVAGRGGSTCTTWRAAWFSAFASSSVYVLDILHKVLHVLIATELGPASRSEALLGLRESDRERPSDPLSSRW
ncbi:hypothetical protein PSPO01_10188 [Paraphaeosphaeria sporulosa]